MRVRMIDFNGKRAMRNIQPDVVVAQRQGQHLPHIIRHVQTGKRKKCIQKDRITESGENIYQPKCLCVASLRANYMWVSERQGDANYRRYLKTVKPFEPQAVEAPSLVQSEPQTVEDPTAQCEPQAVETPSVESPAQNDPQAEELLNRLRDKCDEEIRKVQSEADKKWEAWVEVYGKPRPAPSKPRRSFCGSLWDFVRKVTG